MVIRIAVVAGINRYIIQVEGRVGIVFHSHNAGDDAVRHPIVGLRKSAELF